MDAADERRGHDVVSVLETNISRLVAQLSECREENELLKSEVSSLQNILRSFKLPGSEGFVESTGGSGDGFSPAQKIQVKQKLALMLQKIERELRGERTGF